MKKAHLATSIVLLSLPALLVGCKAKQTPSGNTASESPAISANKNSPGNSSDSGPQADTNSNARSPKEAADSSTPQKNDPPKLIGSYEAREVDAKGVITLMTEAKTTFLFSADGSYTRISQDKGKTYHKDSGTFSIQPPDKLVLTIQVSDKDIKMPPVSKTHTFSLSADGDELKLTSERGNTATFRRVTRPTS